MGLMCAIEYGSEQRAAILALARQGVCQSVMTGSVALPDVGQMAPFLQPQRASFVTLESIGRLRGCIGSLEPVRPLGHDILHNACGAALHDYRFQVLEAAEPIRISVSILSPLQEMQFTSEEDLLCQLEPGKDGVLLQSGRCRSTFLPVVWTSLSQPEVFMKELKLKAGLPADYWSERVRVWRYRSESFAEAVERPACE